MARSRRKKKRTQNPLISEGEREKVPRSFVIARGHLPPLLRQLQHDLRKLMLPHTALHLKERRRNSLKDFLHVAGPLGVTHFLILSNTEKAAYLRVGRCPHGPTLTFKIQAYSLVADIVRAQLRPRAPAGIFKNSPLIVLAGFGSEQEHLKLTTTMFQNIFPAINVKTVKLATCQRVVLLSYNKETKLVEFRHYSIALQPVGVSRGLRKLVQHRKIPNLRGLNDVSEFLTRAGYGSESEAEDEAATVQLASDVGRLNQNSQQSAVKLHEIGPRMSLQLVKVEEGLCSGGIIFHEYVTKTSEEIAALKENKEKRKAVQKQRRAEQEANVRRKEILKKSQRRQSKQGEERGMEVEEGGLEDADDADWYRQEVGQEPDAEFWSGHQRRGSNLEGQTDSQERGKHVSRTHVIGRRIGPRNLNLQPKKRSSPNSGKSNEKERNVKRKRVTQNKTYRLGIAEKIFSQKKWREKNASSANQRKKRREN